MKSGLRHLGLNTFAKHDIEREKAPPCPSFEALEARLLLSGTVLASVVHGNLRIRGDAAANAIVLDQNGLNADQVRISGASGTAINNQADPVVLSGIMRGARIRMGAGDDSVAISNLGFPGNVSVNGGRGADILTIDDSIFHGRVQLNMASGADIIQIEGHGDPQGPPTRFEGRVSISLGSGDDTLQAGAVCQTGNHSVFADRMHFSGGAGYDILINFDSNTYTGASRFGILRFESNATAPTATITAVSPDPRNTAVDSIQIVFSGAVTGFTTADLTLPGVDLTTATLTSADDITWTLGNLTGLTGSTGTYTLTLNLTGVTDLAANAGVGTVSEEWVTDTTAPTADITDVTPDPRNTAVDSIQIVFSEAVTGFTKADLTLPGVDLTTATLTSADNITWTLGNLTGLTGSTGTYTLVLDMTGLTDLATNAGVGTVSEQWVTDTTAPTVISTNPADHQDPVALNTTVAGTFSEAMDLTDITAAANFAVTGPGSTPVTGAVIYDAPSNTVTFTPSGNLAPYTTFTATITGGVSGVKDLAGNPMELDKVWEFTTGFQIAQGSIDLGRAGAFAVMATATITGSGDSITGDVGVHPGSTVGIDPSQITGNIYINTQEIIDAQTDLLAAYNDAVSRTVTLVTVSGSLGGLTFTPGLYWSESSLGISGAPGPGNNLTLDAQGDPNAIFIFQMGSTLTTGPGAHVILAGDAKASNIFWQVGSSASLDTTTIFYGNILAAVSITVNNGAVVEGRLLAGSNGTPSGAVTINGSTVTVPVA